MEKLTKELTEYFREILHSQGMKDPGLGAIMGVLYAEPEEMPLEVLAKKSGYSLSAVSGKIKALEMFGMIQTMHKPGSKKVYVYMIKDLMEHGKKALIAKQKAVIDVGKKKIPKMIEEFEPRAKTEKDKERIGILKNYHEQILSFERIIGKMIKLFEEEDGNK